MKQFYRTIKHQTNNPKTKTKGLKNNSGQIEYDPQKIGKIWENYYKKIFSKVTEEKESPEVVNITQPEPTYEEVEGPSDSEVQEDIKKIEKQQIARRRAIKVRQPTVTQSNISIDRANMEPKHNTRRMEHRHTYIHT